MELKYFNDGKEKWQSHEISLVYDEIYIIGYGSIKKEAYAEFIEKLENKILKITNIRNIISIEDFKEEI